MGAGQIGWLCAALALSWGCSHADELDDLARRRALVDDDQSPASEPPKCVTVLGPAQGTRVGTAQDTVSATPEVEVTLSIAVSNECTARTLKQGLCRRDPSGVPIAPEAWASELAVEPGREYGVAITLPSLAGTHLPCVYLDEIYALPVERVCEGNELLCSGDGACHADTASNPDFCGPSCTACPESAQGTRTCSAGVCGVRCAEGYRYEAGACRPRPACKGLETACKGDDCCAIDLITAGQGQPLKVKRGYDASKSADSLPELQPESSLAVTVSPFYMDRYEVTVARFRRFVDAYESWRAGANPREGHGAHPAVAASGWPHSWLFPGEIDDFASPIYILPRSRQELIDSVTQSACTTFTTFSAIPGERDSLPINCVNYWVAYAYCVWDGESTSSRLPTEAEWNAAAAGGDLQRAYPWSEPPESRDIAGKAEFGHGDQYPYEVGSFPAGAGRWKTQDLAGNLYEWVRDDGVLADGTPVKYVDDASDPIDLAADSVPQTAKVLRGGSFKDFGCAECEPQARLRTSAREVLRPWSVFNDIGIRCVRSFR